MAAPNTAAHSELFCDNSPNLVERQKRTGMTPTELDLRERRIIDEMLQAKLPGGKIAEEIGRYRHRRQIHRNQIETIAFLGKFELEDFR